MKSKKSFFDFNKNDENKSFDDDESNANENKLFDNINENENQINSAKNCQKKKDVTTKIVEEKSTKIVEEKSTKSDSKND